MASTQTKVIGGGAPSSFALMGVCLVLAGSCKPEEEDVADRLFHENVQPIFEQNCQFGCHVPMGYSGFLLLGEDYGSDRIVNVPSTEADLDVIEPGSPDESYMWHKLNGTHLEVGGEGDRMPIIGPLPDDELALIEEWILALDR